MRALLPADPPLGQTGTITPRAPKGTAVHGFTGVDTLNLATAAGDGLVPYSCTVG
jgi:hypothetical protein